MMALLSTSVAYVSADETDSMDKKVRFSVDSETRTELKDLASETQEKMKEFKQKLKDSDDKEAVIQEMKAFHADRVQKVKVFLQDNPEALEAIEKKKESFELKMEKRIENKDTSNKFKWKRMDLVRNYKKKFIAKVWSRLDNISDEKLEKISDKIEKLMERYESNDKISEERKDKFMSQLIALRELIEEKLAENALEDDVIDVDAILDDESEDNDMRDEDDEDEDDEDEDDEDDEDEDDEDEDDEDDEDEDDEDEDE